MNDKKEKLFDLLLNYGFEKRTMDKSIIFFYDDEIIVFPNGKLTKKHLLTTRKHLDMNGWINESEFNKLFMN